MIELTPMPEEFSKLVPEPTPSPDDETSAPEVDRAEKIAAMRPKAEELRGLRGKLDVYANVMRGALLDSQGSLESFQNKTVYEDLLFNNGPKVSFDAPTRSNPNHRQELPLMGAMSLHILKLEVQVDAQLLKLNEMSDASRNVEGTLAFFYGENGEELMNGLDNDALNKIDVILTTANGALTDILNERLPTRDGTNLFLVCEEVINLATEAQAQRKKLGTSDQKDEVIFKMLADLHFNALEIKSTLKRAEDRLNS